MEEDANAVDLSKNLLDNGYHPLVQQHLQTGSASTVPAQPSHTIQYSPLPPLPALSALPALPPTTVIPSTLPGAQYGQLNPSSFLPTAVNSLNPLMLMGSATPAYSIPAYSNPGMAYSNTPNYSNPYCNLVTASHTGTAFRPPPPPYDYSNPVVAPNSAGFQVQITNTTPFDPFTLNNNTTKSSPASSSSGISEGLVIPSTYPSLPTMTGGSASNSAPNLSSLADEPAALVAKKNGRLHSPVPEEIVRCQLCDTKMSVTRYALMVTHARKHCTMKMFQCTECTFASNGRAKVTQHMKQQHSILKTEPITKSESEIEPYMSALIKECFPDYQTQLAAVRDIHLAKNGAGRGGVVPLRGGGAKGRGVGRGRGQRKDALFTLTRTQLAPVIPEPMLLAEPVAPPPPPPPAAEVSHYCKECRKRVKCVVGSENSPDGALVAHLRDKHARDCFPHKCSLCKWTSDKEFKVRRHICVRHVDAILEVGVEVSETPNWLLFLHEFFITLKEEVVPLDEEELKSEAIDRNPAFWEQVSNGEAPPDPEQFAQPEARVDRKNAAKIITKLLLRP